MNNNFKKKKILIKIIQIGIGLIFLILWELLSKFELINSFIFYNGRKCLFFLISNNQS